jgi:hypothetical protein
VEHLSCGDSPARRNLEHAAAEEGDAVIAPGLRPRRHDRCRTSGGARRRGLTAVHSMANEPVAASHRIDGRPTVMDILAADVVSQSRHGGVFNARPAATLGRCTRFLENKSRIAGTSASYMAVGAQSAKSISALAWYIGDMAVRSCWLMMIQMIAARHDRGRGCFLLDEQHFSLLRATWNRVGCNVPC